MVNIKVSTKFNNKWVMLVILIIFDVNKSHVTILSDLCIVAVLKSIIRVVSRKDDVIHKLIRKIMALPISPIYFSFL